MHPIPSLTRAMTPFPYSVDIGATIVEARRLMVAHGIRHLPVMRSGELVGVIAESDLRAVIATHDDASAEDRILVGTVCGRAPYVVEITDSLERVMREMAARQTSCALVVKQGKLVGILTDTDAYLLLADILVALTPIGDDVA